MPQSSTVCSIWHCSRNDVNCALSCLSSSIRVSTCAMCSSISVLIAPQPSAGSADFVVRHVERAAVADETQTFDVARRVAAVIRFGAVRFGQQALFLVEADGFGGAVGNLREFADFHGASGLRP
jgi:hypothetical protein